MLRLCSFALCLALVSSSAINNKRQIGNAFEDYEQAFRQRDKFIINRRKPIGPPKSIPLPIECKTKNSNDMCKETAVRGGTFLTNLEGTSLGPGFPPKPVGLLVRPNVSREEISSTSAPEGRFLVDERPPIPPPPLKRRPLPKRRLRRPVLNSGERQGRSQEDADPIILGPLFYDDVHNPESTTRARENSNGASQENSSGSRERNRAFLDSFNELDHPDPKLLSKFKGKLYPKYHAEKRNSSLNGKEVLLRRTAEIEQDDSNEHSEEENDSKEENERSLEEEGPESAEEAPVEETSEDYESSREEGNQDNSEEHYSAEDESNEQEEPVIVPRPDSQVNSEEDVNSPREHSREEDKSEDSEEEEGQQSNIPPPEEGLGNPPLAQPSLNVSLENIGQNFSSSREEGPVSEGSAESEEQNSASGEAVHFDEDSTEESDYYEEHNNIDSSEPPEDSEEETYHPSAEEETSDESNESAQKPPSSSEDANEIPPTSNESPEEVDEDYDSREQHSQEQYSQEEQSEEQHSQEQESGEQLSQEDPSQEQQSEETPDKHSKEEEEEKATDYYDSPDYDNASPETEYEDVFPKPEPEPTKKPQVYYKKRPATFYYIVGGPVGEKKESDKDTNEVENGSKPLDYEDNDLKQSEEVDSSTPSAEEHTSSISDESFGSMGFDSFDMDSVLKKPKVESDVKTTKSPVAVISNTTPQTGTTKCDDNDGKKNEDPEDQKRLKTPLGTARPNTLQPGDVVSFTRARPVNFGLSPTAQTTTSTFRPATISAIGILKPGGSIIAKVVSPTLQVQGSASTPPPKNDEGEEGQTSKPGQVPWKTLLAAREATALTYLKPPPAGQEQTWFMRQARAPRFIKRLSRPR